MSEVEINLQNVELTLEQSSSSDRSLSAINTVALLTLERSSSSGTAPLAVISTLCVAGTPPLVDVIAPTAIDPARRQRINLLIDDDFQRLEEGNHLVREFINNTIYYPNSKMVMTSAFCLAYIIIGALFVGSSAHKSDVILTQSVWMMLLCSVLFVCCWCSTEINSIEKACYITMFVVSMFIFSEVNTYWNTDEYGRIYFVACIVMYSVSFIVMAKNCREAQLRIIE